jgi:hypothetical protein
MKYKIVLDTPLDYEIVGQGDHYHDPTVGGEYTWLYTVVPTGTVLPEVQYEVLEELFLPKTHTAIMAEACNILGFPYKGNGHNAQQLVAGDLAVINDGMSDDAVNTALGAWTPPPPPPTRPNPPVIIDPDPVTCNRDFSHASPGVPSGRVTLADSQLGTEGVRRVKVNCIGLFYIESAYTDECGYYEMDNTITFDLWYVWGTTHVTPDVTYNIQFENDRARFRTTHLFTSILGQYEMTTTHIIGTWRAPHNGRNFHYTAGTDVHDEATRFWATAQANNALHDFYDFAAEPEIGIKPPPKRLELLLTDFMEGSGVAPMIARNYVTGGQMPLVSVAMVLGSCGITAATAVTPGWGTGVSAAATHIALRVALCPPDVLLGYDTPQFENFNCTRWRISDNFRELCYHEFAHASHYAKVGNTYWEWNMQYMVTHGNTDAIHPYGTGNQDGHERCEIIESWAWCIGHTFAHKKYGGLFNDCVWTRNYLLRLEEEYKQWSIIPTGMFYDLIDKNNDFSNSTEPMDGLTVKEIYGKLDAHTDTYRYFRDRMVELRPNRVNDIDTDLRVGYHLNY